MSTIPEQLDRLHQVRIEAEHIAIEREKLIDAATPPEVKQAIAEIDAEFQPKIDAARQAVEELENHIKEQCSGIGQTVRGRHIMAVFAKGRTHWDTHALDGFAAGHPEILQFKTVGEPIISLRSINGHK